MTETVATESRKRQSPSPPTERVLAILDLLAHEPERGSTLAQVVKTLSISHATAHAILSVLTEKDWVARDPQSATYSVGPALITLGRRAATGQNIIRTRLNKLATDIGKPVFVMHRSGRHLVVTETAGGTIAGVPTLGFRVPVIAPFAREFIAFDDADKQHAWIDALGEVSPQFRHRMRLVLKEIRSRGFSIERFSEVHDRVRTALHALSADPYSNPDVADLEGAVVDGGGHFDAVTVRLAAAIAELTNVDFVGRELNKLAAENIASISAAITTDRRTGPVWSIGVICIESLSATTVESLGHELKSAASDIAQSLSARTL